MNAVQSPAESLVKDVANPGSATQLGGLNVSGRSIHCGDVGAGELGNYLQKCRVLVHHVLSVGVEESLELWGHNIDSGFQFWQTISDVVHQEPVESLGEVGGAIPGG